MTDRTVTRLDKSFPVSGVGSAFFDIVAESFTPGENARTMLRSGAYIVHDRGFHRGISPLDDTRGAAPVEAVETFF